MNLAIDAYLAELEARRYSHSRRHHAARTLERLLIYMREAHSITDWRAAHESQLRDFALYAATSHRSPRGQRISAATLRAWERRYALVEPKRTTSGYRLYSDRDVALLRWAHHQMAEGLTISRVVAMLENMRINNEALYIDADETPVPVYRDAPTPPSELAHALYEALIELEGQPPLPIGLRVDVRIKAR